MYISRTAWQIQLKFGIQGAPTIHRKFICFCLAIFFASLKYMLVCHDTRFQAPWHTTVHLDKYDNEKNITCYAKNQYQLLAQLAEVH